MMIAASGDYLESGIALQNLQQLTNEGVSEIEEDDDAVDATKKEMTILGHLVFDESRSCPEVLAHPVAQTFLDLKWDRMKGQLLLINTGLRIAVYALYIFLAMQIYFYDCPHHPVRNSTLGQGSTAANTSQLEDVMAGECDWSLWTLVPLPIVLFFLSLFLIQEIMKARKFGKKFFYNKFTYLRVSSRMLAFLLAIGTTIPPLFQRKLLAFQYPLAAVSLTAYLSCENAKRKIL
jgi:hypothetical protein